MLQIYQEKEESATNQSDDSPNQSSEGEESKVIDRDNDLKAELQEMRERVDALEEENKALTDQVVCTNG